MARSTGEDDVQMSVALAAIRESGNLDAISAERNQKLAFLNVAHRRKLIIWQGPQGYRLTRRGERLLKDLAIISPGMLKTVHRTRIALACVLILIGGAVASRLDWSSAGLQSPGARHVAAVSPSTERDVVKPAITSPGDMNALDHPAESISPRPKNGQQDPHSPAKPALGSQLAKQSIEASTQNERLKDSESAHRRVQHAKPTKRLNREAHSRGIAEPGATPNSFGYGWWPAYNYSASPYAGWNR